MSGGGIGDPHALDEFGLAATLPEALARHAAATPKAEHLHCVRFRQGAPVATPHSCGNVFGAVRCAATILDGLGVAAGDRVVLAVSDPLEFVAFFAGTQCLGAIPVPCPSLNEAQARAYAERIAGVVLDARPVAMVVDDARAADALPAECRLGARVYDSPNVVVAGASDGVPTTFSPVRLESEVAFLQYTSGSTGAPKGVVVLHGNLRANMSAIIQGGDMGTGDVVFSWLPLFHDMGLVAGLLLGLCIGIPTYVGSPRSFLLRPDSWLRAITRFGATFSAGPNFAFDALARRTQERALAGLSLASWRLAFVGAEAVEPGTCQAFAERYEGCGFDAASLRPAYGLAEATLAVAFARPGRPTRFDRIDREALTNRGIAVPVPPGSPNSVVYTGVGTAVPAHEVRVIDPRTGDVLGDRRVGEIVAVGPSVTPGYFREWNPDIPRRTELRTGDLGYLAEGELFVIDRLKDVLIVAGRNHAPGDLERVVGEVEGVRSGSVVAFSVRGTQGTEEACVVAGLEPRGRRSQSTVKDSIQRLIFEHFGLVASVVLVRPGELPKTSSGKLRRAECRRLFEAGGLRDREEQVAAGRLAPELTSRT